MPRNKGIIEEKSSADNNDCRVLEIDIRERQRCSKRRRRQAQSNLAYTSSSEANLPLSVNLQKEKVLI